MFIFGALIFALFRPNFLFALIFAPRCQMFKRVIFDRPQATISLKAINKLLMLSTNLIFTVCFVTLAHKRTLHCRKKTISMR